jgi:hypothetical protein
MDVDVNFQIAYVLTIITILVKFSLAAYLFKKYRDVETVSGQKINFMMGMLLLLLGYGISRILLFIFDFYWTQLNPDLFYVYPNILLWKAAMFISSIGGIPLIYVVERDIYQLKTKKIPCMTIFIVAVIALVYPVNNKADFDTVSVILSISSIVSLIVPVGFIYLATKTTGQLRKISILIAVAIIIYGIGGFLINEVALSTMEQVIHPGIRTPVIIIFPLLKILSLITASYVSQNFRI